MSYLLNRTDAAAAFELVKPSILAAIESRPLKRAHLHVVVMDPARFPGGDLNAAQAILFEISMGKKDEWQRRLGIEFIPPREPSDD